MPGKKMNSRQAQAIRTRKKIYNAAMDLIKKKGFENTTIEDISKKAKVSVGAFYHYFQSKEGIYFELYRLIDEYYEKDIQSKLTESLVTDKILSFFRYYAEYNVSRGLDAIKQLYNTKNKLFILKSRYMYVLLEEIIRNGQGNGEITKDMTSEDIADNLFIFARGTVYDWCLHEGEYNLVEAMTERMKRILIAFS